VASTRQGGLPALLVILLLVARRRSCGDILHLAVSRFHDEIAPFAA